MQEEWKDIPGYEGIYQISNIGRVVSVNYGGKGVTKERKNVLSSSKYYHISLSKNGKKETRLIHVLVATVFIPNPENKPQVNHIDGNKENNRFDNLEWVTGKENIQHAIRTGLKDPHRTGKIGKSGKPILQYSIDGYLIKVWSSQTEAAEAMECSQSSICKCISGEKKTCKGYVWRKCIDGDCPPRIAPADNPKVRRAFRKLPERSSQRCKKIAQFSKSGELIRIWNNYNELERATGFDNSNIYNCISGKLKTAYGYIWRYAES